MAEGAFLDTELEDMAVRSARVTSPCLRGRRWLRLVLVVVVLAFVPVIYSYVTTVLRPSRLTLSVPAVSRQGGSIVKTLAKIAAMAPIPTRVAHARTAGVVSEPPVTGPPLPAPTALRLFDSPGLSGEGQWHPAGRLADGVPAIYETELRPPGSGAPAGVAWMDTRILAARLYSGSDGSPGKGRWHYTAPIRPLDAATVVAAFNGGFKVADAEGGYYTQGTWVVPPRKGSATLVIYAKGTVALGAWGTDVRMTPDVVSVRQNLHLLVIDAHPAADAGVVSDWGATLGGVSSTWRSGLGITRNGALVYVAGPDLYPLLLADLLIRAGAVRAMELDINPDWTVLATYQPSVAGGRATPANGASLIQGMTQGPWTFFEAWWARDFVTLSARSPTVP